MTGTLQNCNPSVTLGKGICCYLSFQHAMTDERGQTSHAQENKANMKPISPPSLVLSTSSRRRFIQGLAAGGVMLGLSPFPKPVWARKFGDTQTLHELPAKIRVKHDSSRDCVASFENLHPRFNESSGA